MLIEVIHDILSLSRIDILVNNAGFDIPGVTAKIGKADFNAVLSIHLGVPYSVIKNAFAAYVQ